MKEFQFFLLVNPTSGNKEGARYLTINKPIALKFQNGVSAKVSLFNLCEEQSRREAFEQALRVQQDPSIEIRVVVCGGDGSITWVLGEALAVGLDLERVVFGIVPIGTGNDFSRTMGWGHRAPHFDAFHLQGLICLVDAWTRAHKRKFDVWEVELATYPGGKIFDVKSQLQIERTVTTINKMFTNYVGIGLDARVVYTVEKRRTKSAFFNKVVYACVGFCNYFRSMKKLEQVMEEFDDDAEPKEFNILPSVENTLQNNEQLQQELQAEVQADLSRPVLTTQHEDDKLEDAKLEDRKKYSLKNGYRGLVCMNVSSYMAGLRKVWCTKKVAFEKDQKKFKEQAFDDGVIQFVSFKSELNLALQRITRQSSKVAQGCGPFQIIMKDPIKLVEDTFIQIDGESIKVRNLHMLRISKSKAVPFGQINVMSKSI